MRSILLQSLSYQTKGYEQIRIKTFNETGVYVENTLNINAQIDNIHNHDIMN